MKIVLAPDKFKNSLTGLEFCDIVSKGILEILPEVEIIKLPLADGGDGTIEVVNFYLKGKTISLNVNNPFFEPVKASYLYSETTKIAFIEMAEASGVKLLTSNELDCKNATTYGTGEMIVDAINHGALNIIIGIGGSATNDCGIGMAAALGYKFLDKKGIIIKPIGANLSKIASIDSSEVLETLSDIKFDVACDVTNPLYGSNGASFIYAAQKGASPNDIAILDKGLEDFSKILNNYFNTDVQAIIGGGAAGGMGVATKVFLKANLQPGIQLIKKLAHFNEKLEDTNWIISGEGKLDSQTLSGKTIHGVIDSSNKKNINLAVFCGSIELKKKEIQRLGISYSASILDKANNLDDALANTTTHLKSITKDFVDYIVSEQ